MAAAHDGMRTKRSSTPLPSAMRPHPVGRMGLLRALVPCRPVAAQFTTDTWLTYVAVCADAQDAARVLTVNFRTDAASGPAWTGVCLSLPSRLALYANRNYAMVRLR